MAVLLERAVLSCLIASRSCTPWNAEKTASGKKKGNKSISSVWIRTRLSSPIFSNGEFKSSKFTSCVCHKTHARARNSVKSLDEQSEMFRSYIFNFSPIKFLNIVRHIIKRDWANARANRISMDIEIHIVVRLNTFVTIRFTLCSKILAPKKRKRTEFDISIVLCALQLQLKKKGYSILFHRSNFQWYLLTIPYVSIWSSAE